MVFVISSTMYATFGKIVSTVKTLRINSLTQTITHKNHVVFDGEVEVLIDRKMRVWADRVVLDKEKQTLIAQRTKSAAVSIENDDFIMLADQLFLNFEKKTGYADNIRMHISEGYVSARKAEKLDDNDWRMDEMTYTPCDADGMHWHFRARKAVLRGNYFIKASGLLFKVGPVPVFGLPSMILPIQRRTKSGQGKAKSGFLMPRFYFDYDYGFGLRQNYYRYFGPHCDTTIGVDWQAYKGIVFSDEFRWARSPENFTKSTMQYAFARNVFMQKNEKIVKSTAHRYWVEAQNFQTIGAFGFMQLNSLMRMDFGTDKRIGYQFLNNTHDVDDTFSNSILFRGHMSHDIIEARIDADQTRRQQFIAMTNEEKQRFQPLAQDLIAQTQAFTKSRSQKIECKKNEFQKKEIEDKTTVIQVPHVEWNSSYRGLRNIFSYRHDFFVDQVLYRQQELENIYFNATLLNQRDLITLRKADLLRLGYRGNIHKSLSYNGHNLILQINPSLQFRSNIARDVSYHKNVIEHRIFGQGAYRIASEYRAALTFPELFLMSNNFNYVHYVQPSITYEYVPKFFQNHWHYIDKWDRLYPKHEIAVQVRNNNTINDYQIDLELKQGYDFYTRDDIFPLRRALASKHALPFRYDASVYSDYINLSCAQEYDVKNLKMLQSEISTGFSFNRFNTSIGYLYQNTELQKRRELLSNIPHFVLFNLAVPISKHATLRYDGQFYSEHKHSFFSLGSIKPLLHRIRLDYDGHCWGFYIGFEEKKYREYGTEKAEHYFVFSLKLESIGSFANKIRQPSIDRKKD